MTVSTTPKGNMTHCKTSRQEDSKNEPRQTGEQGRQLTQLMRTGDKRCTRPHPCTTSDTETCLHNVEVVELVVKHPATDNRHEDPKGLKHGDVAQRIPSREPAVQPVDLGTGMGSVCRRANGAGKVTVECARLPLRTGKQTQTDKQTKPAA